MHVVIHTFELPPATDEGGRLYRAIRPDVAFRFVSIRPEAIGDRPTPADSASYEIVREDGAVDGPGGTTLIHLLEDEALGWQRVRDVLAAQPGHLGSRSHRAVGTAEFAWVDLVRWSSPLMYSRALEQLVSPPPGHAALYDLVGP